MKRIFVIIVSIFIGFTFCGVAMAAPITSTVNAGDKDFAATRNAYDNTTNMDWYVFATSSESSGAATNNAGLVEWTYTLPNQIVTANSGSMTLRTWDIDPSDQMDVYFDFGGGNRVYAGSLTGTNGGNIGTWEDAVTAGTTASLNGWSVNTFSLDAAALAALSGTSGFNLLLNVQNNEVTGSWAAVIDYADFTLTYEPGAPNQVPEPASLFLLGLGLVGIAGVKRKFNK